MNDRKQDINKMVSSYKPPFNKTKEDAWNNIISSIENDSKIVEKRTIIFNKPWLIAAASVLLIITLSWFIIDKSHQEYYVENGKSMVVTLPDKSMITLNSDSYLSYSNLFWRYNRSLKLSGEAYFKVSVGKKFKVITPIAQVQVVGTEFNTFSRGAIFEAKCFSGHVKVKFQKNEINLTKGKAFKMDKSINESKQYSFDNISKKDWRSGEFYFTKKSLQFVFSEVQRQYNVEITASEDIKNRIYTGYFSNQNLEEALDGICLPMQLKYTIKNKNSILINEI